MPNSRIHGRAALRAAALATVLAVTSPVHALVEAGPIAGPAGGHSYYLLAPGTWIAAENEAIARGGHLVAIGDAAENAWVWNTFAALGSAPFWIGLTDVAQEGTFVWTNGEPLAYTSWWTAGGEPNNAGGVEHFGEINNGLWNDRTPAGPLRGIVEVERAFGFVEAETTPPGPPSSFAGALDLAVSPDGDHVYALYDLSPGDDLLLTYARGTDGALALLDASAVLAFNPNVMAMAPDGSALFVATNNGELQAWHRTPATGLLDFADGVSDGVDGGGYLQFASGVAVSPDGENVYVASGENAVTTFAWDGAALTLVETDVTGTGDLVLSAAGSLAVTPDGAFVLVVSQLDAALVVFARNPASGTLDFVERFADGVNGVDGLDAPAAIAVAPTATGSAAYVSSFENEIAVFSQTPAGVSFVEAVPVNSLQPALAVSPDGTLLYLSDRYASRVTAYDRDPDGGDIGPIAAAIADTDPGVDGLGEAGRAAASPDGLHLYVASPQVDAIAVLATPAPVPEPGIAGLALAALLALRAVVSASGNRDPGSARPRNAGRT